MNVYKYLLFDADETLFDFKAGEKCAFKEALESLNIEYTEERYSLYHEINDALWKALERGETTREKLKIQRFEEFFDRIGVSQFSVENMASEYIEALSHQRFAMPEAEETVKLLSEKYRIFIITNGITYIQKNRLRTSVFENYVEKMFISEEMGVTKPSCEYFNKVIKEIGDGDRSAYLIIGDSLTADIDGGINSGIDTCLYDYTGNGCGGRKVTYVISSLSELTKVL